MTVVTQKLLPSAKIVAKKKTIPVSAFKPVEIENSTETSSLKEKLILIKNFLGEKYERGLTSWRMKRRQRQEEKRRLREEKIEKKKETKLTLPKGKVSNPFSNIFDSISNFLLFLGGGLLLNDFFKLQDAFVAVEKILPAIKTGISIFTGVISGVTNFIDSSYAGYDKFKKQISDITGVKEEDVEKFSGLLNKVINGTIIAAMITLRALPRLLKKPPKPDLPKIPKTPTTTSRMQGGSNTGIDYRKGFTPSGQRLRSPRSISRFNNSMAKFIKGTADPGDVARLLKGGFFKPFAQFSSPLLDGIPIIGGIVDFLVNFFLFKEPLGKSAFLAAGSTLGGFIGGILGSVAGPPGAIAGGVLGGIGGDWAARALYETIFGDVDLDLAAGLTENASYDLISDITTNIIQPIEV